MTQSKSYDGNKFWESEPVKAGTPKDSLETYLNELSVTYAKERSKDAFKPHLQKMIVVGIISFFVAFIVGYPLNYQQSIVENNFEFSLILGISAATAAAIVFAALGGHAIQSQNDRLSALSDKMDHVRDRIASTELEEAISKREKMRISSSTMSVSNQFYTEIRRDIQRASKNKDQYEKILRRRDIALNLSPEDFQQWHYRGIAHGKKGDFGQAIYFFDKVIQTNYLTTSVALYNKAVALYNKAVALAALDQKVEAQTILEDLLSLNPNDSKAQELLDRVRDGRPIRLRNRIQIPVTCQLEN